MEQSMTPAMALALSASFGSEPRWREEFAAMARAPGGGSGWVVLCFQPRDGSLANQRAAGPSHMLDGSVPLLALDLHEHSEHQDFDAFMKHIDWADVYARYQKAVHAATEGLAVERADIKDARLLDVRRAGMFEQASHIIPKAQWRDPATVAQWAADLPRDEEVVVYCVYGHEVGRATALRLRAQGIRARFLEGGIDGWKTAGLPLADKPPAA